LQSLKKIRVVVSLLFFFLLSFLFVDLWNVVPVPVSNVLVSIQLVPSITKTLTLLTATSFGLLFVVLLTLLFGRVYCSSICPLGTLQDLVIRVAGRNRKHRWFRYSGAPVALHYAILAVVAIAFLGGSTLLLNLVEPFSNHGRIFSTLVSPIVVLLNNAVAWLLGQFGTYSLPTLAIRSVVIGVTFLPLAFLAVVVYLSYNYGRLFCNSLCPAGALLAILSRVSLFKIVIDEETCTECKLCEKVCKARCIQADTKRLDFDACVSCFNCIDVCPSVGLKYEALWKNKISPKPAEVDTGRRTFMNAAVTSLLAAVVPGSTSQDTTAASALSFDESRRHPIAPPGAISIEHFSSLCTACHLCVTVCPTQVLYPSLLEYGVAGILQPKMNYAASYCNYDCILCTEICPSGAILPVTAAAKKEIQIGKSVFVKEDCVVVSKKKACAACAEHCPTKAVRMVPYEGNLMIPELNNEICVGCGACEYPCPTEPRRAIYVVANSVHQKAKRPKVERLEEAVDKSKEFPF